MTMMEPFAPWLRDVNRFIAGQNAPAAFIPPADVVVTDRGVTIHMDVPGLTTAAGDGGATQAGNARSATTAA